MFSGGLCIGRDEVWRVRQEGSEETKCQSWCNLSVSLSDGPMEAAWKVCRFLRVLQHSCFQVWNEMCFLTSFNIFNCLFFSPNYSFLAHAFWVPTSLINGRSSFKHNLILIQSLFRYGRTETVRPCTIETEACSKAFDKDHSAGIEEMSELLR